MIRALVHSLLWTFIVHCLYLSVLVPHGTGLHPYLGEGSPHLPPTISNSRFALLSLFSENVEAISLSIRPTLVDVAYLEPHSRVVIWQHDVEP